MVVVVAMSCQEPEVNDEKKQAKIGIRDDEDDSIGNYFYLLTLPHHARAVDISQAKFKFKPELLQQLERSK